jgi:hypothetical protein
LRGLKYNFIFIFLKKNELFLSFLKCTIIIGNKLKLISILSIKIDLNNTSNKKLYSLKKPPQFLEKA